MYSIFENYILIIIFGLFSFKLTLVLFTFGKYEPLCTVEIEPCSSLLCRSSCVKPAACKINIQQIVYYFSSNRAVHYTLHVLYLFAYKPISAIS